MLPDDPANETRMEQDMKITGAKIYIIRIGTLHPVLLELVTDEGFSGIGEAGVAYGVGGTAAAGMVKDFVEGMLLGRDPFRIEEIWTEMYDHSFWAKGGGPIVFAGISAIEQALWDIKGQALRVPVYELLGGKFRDTVRLYANGWSYMCGTPDDYARAAEQVVEAGYTALKLYPLAVPNGRGGIRHVSARAVERDFYEAALQKMKAVRRACGPGIDLMADLSGGTTTEETIRFCRALEELDLYFVEEPADPFDIGALRKISEQVKDSDRRRRASLHTARIPPRPRGAGRQHIATRHRQYRRPVRGEENRGDGRSL